MVSGVSYLPPGRYGWRNGGCLYGIATPVAISHPDSLWRLNHMVDPTSKTEGNENASTELTIGNFSDAQLRNLSTLEDIKEIVGGKVENASDYGNGFSLLEDKSRLCNVPIVFLAWNEHKGD